MIKSTHTTALLSLLLYTTSALAVDVGEVNPLKYDNLSTALTENEAATIYITPDDNGKIFAVTAEQIDGRSIIFEDETTARLFVTVDYPTLSESEQSLTAYDLNGITVDSSNRPSAQWGKILVTGGFVNKFKLFWANQDADYYEDWPDQDADINTAGVDIAEKYIDYLANDGAPILDIVQTKVSKDHDSNPDTPNVGVPTFAERRQTLHDNVLGNLGDGPIASRFGDDPRSEEAKDYGTRPYHDGTLETGEYKVAALAVLQWDIDKGINYFSDLPSSYPATILANGTTLFTTLADAVAAANENDDIELSAGVYTQTATLTLNKNGLTITGAGQGETIINSQAGGYGVLWTANDITLEHLTYNGPTNDAGSSYGFKIQPPNGASTAVQGISISNVTVVGSGRSEIDLHYVDGATISNVALDGKGTKGVGVALTASQNVTLQDITTTGNLWGAVGVFTKPGNNDFTGDPDTSSNVTINNLISDEAVSLYGEGSDASPTADTERGVIPGLAAPQFTHIVRNPTYRNNGSNFTHYRVSAADAITFAGWLQNVDAGLGAGKSTAFSMATSTFLVSPDLTIQAAVNAAENSDTIFVDNGTYTETVNIPADKDDIAIIGVSADSTTLVGGIKTGINDNIEIANMTIQDGIVIGGTDGGIIVNGNTSGHSFHDLILVGAGDKRSIHFESNGETTATTGVTITDVSASGWKSGMYINPKASVTITRYTGTAGGGISIDGPVDPGIVIQDSSFTDSGIGLSDYYNSATAEDNRGGLTVTNTTFAGVIPDSEQAGPRAAINLWDTETLGEGDAGWDAGPVTIVNSRFTTQRPFVLESGNAWPGSDTDKIENLIITATHNYWGRTSGPNTEEQASAEFSFNPWYVSTAFGPSTLSNFVPPPPPDPDPVDEIEDQLGDVDVPPEDSDETISDEAVINLNTAADNANNTANTVAQNIDTTDTNSAVDVLSTLSNVADKSGAAASNTTKTGNTTAAESVVSSGQKALNSISTVLDALNTKATTTATPLTDVQKTAVQSATVKTTASAVKLLAAADATKKKEVLNTLGKIITTNVNLGVSLTNDQAATLKEAATSSSDSSADAETQLETSVSLKPINKALITKDDLTTALGSSATDEEITSFLSDLAQSINPADIDIGGITGDSALTTGLDSSLGAQTNINFDPATGTIFVTIGFADTSTIVDGRSLQAATVGDRTIPARVVSTNVVGDSFPNGVRVRANGSVIITSDQIASVVVPASYDPINFYADMRDIGVTTVNDQGNVKIVAEDYTFSGTFDFRGYTSTASPIEKTSFLQPTQGDESSVSYVFLITYRDGTQQRLQPYVGFGDFINSVRGRGLQVNTNRNNGVITVNGKHYRPSYFIDTPTAMDMQIWNARKDAFGIAYRGIDENNDGTIDYRIITETGVQTAYRVK